MGRSEAGSSQNRTRHGNPEEVQLLQTPGVVILASSPCSLYHVEPGDEVLVTCVGMEVKCVMGV